MKVAALDLGSNSFLCLIANCEKNCSPEIISDTSVVVRLGQGVQQTQRFHPEALQRARKCLTQFKEIILQEGVDKIIAVTTSAARDVKNLKEFIQIGEDLGISIQLISGTEEALLTYKGAFLNLPGYSLHKPRLPVKKNLVIDVGGGSTEFIYGDLNHIVFAKSLQMGGVRFTEQYISTQPVEKIETEKLSQEIQNQLKLLQFSEGSPIDEIIAVAGTPTALAILEVGQFDPQKIHGYSLHIQILEKWMQEFQETSIDYKKEKYQLGQRADIIYVGTSILLETLRFF